MTVTVDLSSADTYLAGVPHEVFTELRRTQPVYWQDMPGDEPGYWAVLKHADVVHVAREANLFSAAEAGIVLETLQPELLEMMRNMLLAMDPPRHNLYRKPVAPSFKRKVIAELEPRIRSICRDIVADAAEQRDVEIVHGVAGPLPSRVVGELVGIPEKDWDYIHELAEMITKGQDPDVISVEDHETRNPSIEMAMYAIQFAAERRTESEPREDLTSVVLGGEYGGEPMSDVDFGSFFVQLVTAGNDTTVGMLANGLHALLTHPDQMQLVRDDPSLAPGVVEETLRWANPLHYFRRTATADTEIRGTPIKAGDKVAMYYTSANRDEDVFDDPQRYNIRRNPNPHLAFGIAEHFCLGVHLARLEGKVFFEEMLARFPKIEQTGDAVRTRSNLNNGLKSLPARLTCG